MLLLSNLEKNNCMRTQQKTSGYTLIELVIGMSVLAIVALSVLSLFSTLANSAAVTKRKAIASNLATNQMEYLKSLPYDSLAVAGGSIYATNPLPNSITKTYNGLTYTIKTSINYVDDAFDGCGSYPTLPLKQTYCRSYPPPAGAPATDTNPADYKDIHVSVYAPSTSLLADVDTQVSARVAETASTTGALFVTVIDDGGNPVSGATAAVTNTTVNPNVNLSDTTDSNGVAIFYGLPPDTTGYDYAITASKSGYSTLSTLPPSGALQPTYPSQQIITQLSSSVTLTIKKQGADSLVIETTNTSGAALGGIKVYIKGGYKKYTSTSNTAYYYDNLTPSDTRPTTDGSGLASVSNLVPGSYIFCGDAGATSCQNGGTTYYLAAAVPYTGSNALNPITIPTYDPVSPPTTTFSFSGNNYYQKVRLMLTTNSNFPRVSTLTPDDASLASGLSAFAFTLKGTNLPCSNNPNSCSTSVKFLQGANTYTASCTGTSGTALNCTVNLSSASVGMTQLQVTSGGNTLTLPASPPIGGINVTP
jgi:prepilin-type N-terminal cleavage/methylation domain-containing protein